MGWEVGFDTNWQRRRGSVNEWISVKERKPRIPRGKRDVVVLVWPHYGEQEGYTFSPIAVYGKRFKEDKRASFRIYGATLYPTHWMPLPAGPTDSASGGHST